MLERYYIASPQLFYAETSLYSRIAGGFLSGLLFPLQVLREGGVPFKQLVMPCTLPIPLNIKHELQAKVIRLVWIVDFTLLQKFFTFFGIVAYEFCTMNGWRSISFSWQLKRKSLIIWLDLFKTQTNFVHDKGYAIA